MFSPYDLYFLKPAFVVRGTVDEVRRLAVTVVFVVFRPDAMVAPHLLCEERKAANLAQRQRLGKLALLILDELGYVPASRAVGRMITLRTCPGVLPDQEAILLSARRASTCCADM